MSEDYQVRQGDCMNSIAFEYGFFWETLWNHASNGELKQKRKDPNVLMEGDVVHIPDRAPKEESGATEQRHRFRRKGVPITFRVRLLQYDEPIADATYTLDVDGRIYKGRSDGDGIIEEFIQPDARSAHLLLDEQKLEYSFNLGHLDPADTVAGAQARLNNLGHDCGAVDGVLGPRTEAALRAFQSKHEVTVTGTLNAETIDCLKKVHGN
jgi:N-acetylmuramoyl-L-alanine amidase